MDDFNFVIPLQKDINSDLIGIASTTSVDRDSERMSDTALQMMVDDFKTKGINLFGNHEHNWENTLGVIRDANLVDNKVQVKITLDEPSTNPKVTALLNKLKKGINLGLSVGGNVVSEKYENRNGKRVKILDKVKIYELSIVGIPSNPDAFVSIASAIAKSAGLSQICPICYSDFKKKCNICFYNNNN